MGGVFTKLIERNTTIPTKKSQIFSTAADNQTSVDVHVLQGERELAAYNKTLGRFQLSGIVPAPRGVPQIEVTFDIDANGIVNVSAKDMGTGAEQKITITASSNLSEADIEKAVKEAEQFAAEDKKIKEQVDTKNMAESSAYQAEKTLKDLEGKIEEGDKATIEAAIAKVKDAIAANNYDDMKSSTEALQNAFNAVAQKIYSQNPGAAGAGFDPNQASGAAGNGDDNVYDADYTVVDDDNK